MNHVVPCPSCSHKLSVPDEVVGRTVRCPVCQTAFEAAAPSGPAPPPVPPLSLDDAAAPEAPALPRNLWGAVEIEASGGAPPPLPRASDPDPPERPRPRRRDEDARARCPECGARMPAGAPCCVRCGVRPDRDDRPRGRRSRREEEPHRGGAVLTLGVLSLVLSFCAPVGLTLGIIAWVMGQGDLTKMRRRGMDPEGQGATTGGWICGMIGVVLSAIFLILSILWFLAAVEESSSSYRTYPVQRNRRGF